jgi:hypothetical protein
LTGVSPELRNGANSPAFEIKDGAVQMPKPKIPADLARPKEKAEYCRKKAVELLNAASDAREADNKLTLLNLSEQWMALALYYEKKTKDV